MSEPEQPLHDDDQINLAIERAEATLRRLYAQRAERFVCESSTSTEWRWCRCGRVKMHVDKSTRAACVECE